MEHDVDNKRELRTAGAINGRDEMNLADFPISVLQRHQGRTADGKRPDTVVFRSTRYDPRTRRTIPQQVTLTTSSRYGLPTPADEDVILALLHVGKETHGLTDPKVFFTPHHLFRIMRWAPNSRSYHRFQAVLRRLKALTIVYENAWWDARGRHYEQELATGIIAEYATIRRQGRRSRDESSSSWIVWTPRFFESISSGNLKTIDLDRLFGLRLPTARRMYRFLDKRFHRSTEVEIDLRDFACGHIGLGETDNIAILKQRLAPAISELEQNGLVAAADREERFRKVRPGIWRVRFQRYAPATPLQIAKDPLEVAPNPAEQLVGQFYRLWKGSEPSVIPAKHATQAAEILKRFGRETAVRLIPRVVDRLRVKWPNAQTFGAVISYIDEVAGEYEQQQQREARLQAEQANRKREEELVAEQQERRQRFEEKWQPQWNRLSVTEQQAIRFSVLHDRPWLEKMPATLHFHCLEALAKQSYASDSPREFQAN